MSRSWMQNMMSGMSSPFSSSSRAAPEPPPRAEIVPGRRVQLDVCLDKSFEADKPELWRADKAKRYGCLLHTEHSHDTDLYGVVGLDKPLNARPSAAETVAAALYLCAPQFESPAQHIVCIPASLVHKGRVVVREVKCDFHMLPEKAVVKCQLDECGRGSTRRRMLYTCHTYKHMLCMEHLIPWDKVRCLAYYY